jgi:ubiquinone/menaquinone biosynthesis C-methylase UbiE
MDTATPHLALDERDRSLPWDAAAAGWNHHAAMIHDWLQPATLMMLDEARIKLGSRVLDLAAGAGDQTIDIAHRVGSEGRVVATDISPAILALAQKNAQIAGLKQITTLIADAQSLGLAGADFDAAVCRLGLMFCRSPLVALTEIRAALRSKGRFSAVVFDEPAQNPCLTIALTTARKHAGLVNLGSIKIPANVAPQVSKDVFEPGTLMSLGKPGLFEELLKITGYIDVTARHISAPFHASSVEHYIDFLRSSASPVIEILAPLSATAQKCAWADMTEQLRIFSSKSGWDGPNELILCSATAP